MAPTIDALVQIAKMRRTYYALGKKSPVPDAEVLDLIKHGIRDVPSAFNTQSSRVVLAFHRDHEKIWNITAEVMRNLVTKGVILPDTFEQQTKPKLESFKAAYGTILFYEDPSHIEEYSTKFPALADKFPQWADHSNAMLQYFLWIGLETLGFGANLQHYNPLIDAALSDAFGIPREHRLVGQLVFGSIEAPPKEKSHMAVEKRLQVIGSK